MATYDLGTATGISDNDDIADAIKGVHDSGLDSDGIKSSIINASSIIRNSATDGYPSLTDDIYSPLEIDNCTAWFDAKTGSYTSLNNFAGDGDSVGLLYDLSGNSNHATLSSGDALYNAETGYIDCTDAKWATSGFITSDYNNALTVFVVMEVDPDAKTSKNYKYVIYGGSTNHWLGMTPGDGKRDLTISGLTGFTQALDVLNSYGGVDFVQLGDTELRFMTNGLGATGSSSNTSITKTITANASDYDGASLVIGGYGSNNNSNFSGEFKEFIVFNEYLDDEKIRKVMRYLNNKHNDKKVIVNIGSSSISGTGSTSGATQITSVNGDNYPSYLWNLIGEDNCLVRTDAYPGRRLESMLSDSPSFSGLAFDCENRITVIEAGSNSLSLYKSPQKALSELKRLCAMNRGVNRKVYVCTIPYRPDYDNDTYGKAIVDKYNTLIRENFSDFADGICDIMSDSRLIDNTDETYYYTDHQHMNSNGYSVKAQIIYDVIWG